MAWRVEIRPPVRQAINGLFASGVLSRAGWIAVHTALYVVLPQQARRRQANRYVHDPDCFVFPVQFHSPSGSHRFTFHVRDTLRPGLLAVEGVEHKTIP